MKVKGIGSFAELARIADKDPSVLYKMESNPDQSVRQSTLEWIANAMGITVAQLNTEISGDITIGQVLKSKQKSKPSSDSVLIKEIDGYAGMGLADGCVEPHNEDGIQMDGVKAHWKFPAQWIAALGVNSSQVYIIEALGDSNSPVIQSGDKIMVDTNDRTPSPPGFFALWDGLGVVIKRIEVVHGSDPIKILIKSANSAYESYERTLDEVQIIGRVRAGVLRM